MIGRVLSRGKNVRCLLTYLFGKGKAPAEHINPHLIASWDGDPADLEPSLRADAKRNFNRLTELLEFPVQITRGEGRKVADKFVYHVALRCAPGDRILSDGEWRRIVTEVMHRIGLSVRGREAQGVRWVAVRHAPDHVHIVATLAGQDWRPAWPRNDYYRIGEALRDFEREYGLQVTGRADRTAPRGLSRGEWEQRKAGREPDRPVLYRKVRTAAASARTEEEFFAALKAVGLEVGQRPSKTRPGEVIGYAVALDGGKTWIPGRKLAADLSLPKLRRRWTAGPGRLSGRGMTARAAQTVLAREVARAARATHSEDAFFALLSRAGLQVRLRPGAARPGDYEVTLPGLADAAGRPAWYPGRVLGLPLSQLRDRWQAGEAGAGPGPDYFDGLSRAEVFEHAARVADQAAVEMKAAPAARPDIAWAAADVLTAAAEVTGNRELAQAAEGFTRAARATFGRVPEPSPAGDMLRTAAYLVGACRRSRVSPALCLLLVAIAVLAGVLADLRKAQDLRAQQAAALSAAARLRNIIAAVDQASATLDPAVTFPSPPRPSRPVPRPRPGQRPPGPQSPPYRLEPPGRKGPARGR